MSISNLFHAEAGPARLLSCSVAVSYFKNCTRHGHLDNSWTILDQLSHSKKTEVEVSKSSVDHYQIINMIIAMKL